MNDLEDAAQDSDIISCASLDVLRTKSVESNRACAGSNLF